MYNLIIKFEWNANKNLVNQERHGIDFETAANLWLDENHIIIDAPHPVEDRHIIIGTINNIAWTGVFTVRGEKIRIISVRRSRKKETAFYEKEKTR